MLVQRPALFANQTQTRSFTCNKRLPETGHSDDKLVETAITLDCKGPAALRYCFPSRSSDAG